MAVKHYSEKELIDFAQKLIIEEDEVISIKKHLEECFKCSMKYSFLNLKSGLKSQMKYEKAKAEKYFESCPDEDKLKSYLIGDISKKEKLKIENHLYCCRKCAEVVLSMDVINVPSLWESIENTISEVTGWLKDIHFIPVGLEPVMSTRISEEELQKVMKPYEGDDLVIKIPVERDGFLTVIHWNGEDLSFVLPNIYEGNVAVKAGEVRKIEAIADPPAGIQYLKVFITEDKILNPGEINFDDKDDVYEKLKGFTKKLQELDESKWSQQIVEYEVRKVVS